MTYRVPFVDPREHYRRLKPEIDGAILGCLATGDLIYRQQLRDFEAHLAAFVGVSWLARAMTGTEYRELRRFASGMLRRA